MLRELALAQKLLDAAYKAGFDTKTLDKIADNPERLKQFLDLHREDARIEYIERMLDCTIAPLIFPHSKNDTGLEGLKVVRHNNPGIVPWKSLKLRFYRPDSNASYEQFEFDMENLMPRYLVGMKVADVNIREYLLRYPHLIPEDGRHMLHSCCAICWGTIYENADGTRWAPGINGTYDPVTPYDTHANDMHHYNNQVAIVIDD